MYHALAIKLMVFIRQLQTKKEMLEISKNKLTGFYICYYY